MHTHMKPVYHTEASLCSLFVPPRWAKDAQGFGGVNFCDGILYRSWYGCKSSPSFGLGDGSCAVETPYPFYCAEGHLGLECSVNQVAVNSLLFFFVCLAYVCFKEP